MKKKLEGGILYCHVNKINNKKYWGVTKHVDNPNKRWKNGSGYKKQFKFYNAILKYGWDNFEHHIVSYFRDIETLNEAEQFWIKATDSMKNGYNSESGGNIKFDVSEESKRRMSEYAKNRPKEHNQKIAESTKRKRSLTDKKGTWMTEEHKNKISETHKGKPKTEEHKRKMSNAKKGKPKTEEHKRKMSESQKKRRKNEKELI